MPTVFDFLYREHCRARLAEMRKQLLLVSAESHEVRVGHPACVSAWNKDPVFGVIGIQSGPRH
jgi:hypothetical protein